ncbi:zinc ribbon domain-containing protein [bacterium]|nr:MAG: zinc ribbon domain-containing protein [bacterium]
MEQMYSCPGCGAQVAFGVRFCTNCGTTLNWPTQQQTQPPPVYQQQQRRGQGYKMMEKAGRGIRWYWYLGLVMVLQFLGIPWAILKGLIYLVDGQWELAVVQVVGIPLNLLNWILVTVPNRIAENPPVGIGLLIGNISILVVGIWLLYRGGKRS